MFGLELDVPFTFSNDKNPSTEGSYASTAMQIE